jgi:hypothetical protein
LRKLRHSEPLGEIRRIDHSTRSGKAGNECSRRRIGSLHVAADL